MLTGANSDSFDWFRHDSNNDDESIVPIKQRESQLTKAFDGIVGMVLYLLCLLAGVRLFRFFFHENDYILYGFNFNVILNIAIIFFGSLILVICVLRAAGLLLTLLGQKGLERKLSELQRLLALFLWFSFGYIKIKNVEREMHTLYGVSKRVLLAGIATTVAYAVGTVTMNWFRSFFIKKSLNKKVAETEKTERVLKAFKHFCYGIEEVASSESELYSCPDIFYIDIFSNREEGNAESSAEAELSRIKKPAIHIKQDAMRLARDVFLKASQDGQRLCFREFSKIFDSKGAATEAYEYFNSNSHHHIERKNFRDVTLYFYRNRNILERTIQNTLHFVDMIRKVVFAVIFVFLFIIWMIIFGFPFRDLLALALSSALALNFVASGVLNESLRNLVMIFSHQFDIGDEVLIDKELLTVYNIGMASTSFICTNGGKIKFLNSDLWRKSIINMTKAPQKILVFTFTLPATVQVDEICRIKSHVHEYLCERHYDFFEAFTMSSGDANSTGLAQLPASVTLQCRGYKTRSRRFLLRAEFTAFLRVLFDKLEINAK